MITKEITDRLWHTHETLPEPLLLEVFEEFFKLAREAGIKEGTDAGDGGRICTNSQWTALLTLFTEGIRFQMQTYRMFEDFVPEDLQK